jgi:hypothetical protein
VAFAAPVESLIAVAAVIAAAGMGRDRLNLGIVVV